MTAVRDPALAACGRAHAGPAAGRELRTVLELVSPMLRRSAAALWCTDDMRERYRRYLPVMHAVTRASVPLMELAVDHCLRAGPDDRVLGLLGRYLPTHIEQELHHDDWLVRDMAAAGLAPSLELARPPSPDVARLVGAQYYWINHYHPICLLGYIAVLELNAPAVGLADLLAEGTGLPASAFDTLRLHAEIDSEHSRAILTLLDEAALSAELRHGVRMSALHTVRALADVFGGLTTTEKRTRYDVRTRSQPS